MSPITIRDGAPRAAGDAPRTDCAPSDPLFVRTPTIGRVVVACGAYMYIVRAIPQELGDPARVIELVPLYRRPSDHAGPVIVEACLDPEHGSHHPAYLGMACSCDAYRPDGAPCEHLIGIAALADALPRPAPSWGDEELIDEAVIELHLPTVQPLTGDGYPIRSLGELVLLLRTTFRRSKAFAEGIVIEAIRAGVLFARRDQHGRVYIIPTPAWYDWLGKALAGERRRRKGGAR